MRTLIRHGTVVTATTAAPRDVLIEGDTIARVEPEIGESADRVVDARGKYVIPGGIDVHTHLDMPLGDITTSDDFESGTIAAAFGGTTSIVDFAVQERGRPLAEAFETWMRKAAGKAVLDYGFHMIVCDLPPERESELDALVAEGITSFKLFMAYPGRLMLDDATIARVLKRTAANGGRVLMHAEDGAAIEALVRRALAEGHTAPKYHALTRPPPRKRMRPGVRSPWRARLASRSTSCTCRRPRRWTRSRRRALAVRLSGGRPAPSTSSSPTSATRRRASRARST